MATLTPTVSSIDRPTFDQVRQLHAALALLGFNIDPQETDVPAVGKSTLEAIRAIERSARLEIDESMVLSAEAAIEISRRVAAASVPDARAEALIVEGTVTGADGVAIGGLLVEAFDQDLRARQSLGRAVTDRSGRYAIGYAAPSFERAEKGYADVVVVVSARDGAVLHESEVEFNAQPRLVRDIRLERRGPALFDRLVAAVSPLLEGQKLALHEIDQGERFRDVTFLSGETGFAAADVAALGVASRLSEKTALDASLLFALVLGGLWPEPGSDGAGGIRDLGGRAESLRARFGEVSRVAVVEALEAAVARGVVATSKETIDRFASGLVDLARREDGRGGRAVTPEWIARLLGPAAKAVQDHVTQAKDLPDLVARLRGDPKAPPETVRKVDALSRLSTATLGDAALVAGLANDIDSPAAVARLARLDAAGWTRLATDAGMKEPPPFVAAAGGDLERYGALMAARFATLYPGQALVGRAQRRRDVPERMKGLVALLKDDPELDLGEVSLDRYLAPRDKRGAKAAARRKDAALLKPLQRLYKVSSDFDAIVALSARGLHSAQAVYRRGEDQIVRLLVGEAGLSERAARLAYERAAATAAASMQVAASLASEADNGGVRALGALDGEAVPEFATLFALGNDCTCEDCRSVLSPAAYLADLLMFLSHRAIGGGRSAKDVLLARRPDLAWIDLDCDNAFTPLPYIDLAIEAMEDLIAPDEVGALAAALHAALPTDADDHPVPPGIVAAFASFAPPVALSSQARVRKAGESWVVRDGNAVFRIPDSAAALSVLRLRNTHGTSAERELLPEYQNDWAAGRLAGKTFPWTLPSDLATAEVSASLGKLRVGRGDLMRALRGPGVPSSPLDVAAADLGTSSAVATLIVTSAPDPSSHWGAPTLASAVADRQPVPAFLEATGLTYADLLRLLSLPFANAGGALSIEHADESCDLAQKRVVPLDGPSLDRLHRFLRLARALCVPLADADLLVRRFGGGSLSAPQDLVAIADAMRARAALGDLAVEELVSLFSDIPVEDRFDAPHEPPLPSLYARLFLDPTVHRPVAPAFAVAAVTAAAPPARLADHRPAIAAALGIAGADLDLLLPLAGPELSLANLSTLYRNARVCAARGMALTDWLVFARLSGDPFASPAALIGTLDAIGRAERLGLDPATVSLLLESRADNASAIGADTISESLAKLRASLRAVDEETAPPSADADVSSLLALLSRALEPLDPDAARAARIADVVQGRFLARSTINPAPAQPVPASGVAGLPITIVTDGTAVTVAFAGLLSPAARTALLNPAQVGPVAADPSWVAAIDSLEEQARLPLATISTRDRAALAAWPAGVVLPPALKRRARFIASARALEFDGVMTTAERDSLLALSVDPAFQAAVTSIYARPRTSPVPAADRLADFTTWQYPSSTDDPATADAKVRGNLLSMLAVVLPRARDAATADRVVTTVMEVSGLERDAATAVVRRVNVGGSTLLATLSDRVWFVSPETPVTPAGLSAQFVAVDLLHRTSRMATALRMSAREIELGLTLASAVGSDLIDPGSLPPRFGAPPAAPPPSPRLLERLLRLGELHELDRRTARKEIRLLDLIAQIASDPASVSLVAAPGTVDFCAVAETSLGWSSLDVAALLAPGAGLGIAYPADLSRAVGWLRVRDAIEVARRLRLPATDALRLATPTPAAAEAAIARQAMRARLGVQFAAAGREVQDAIRTLRRDALCDYLLAYVRPGVAGLPASPTGGWQRATDVFAYLLIDPKMGACQMTSRIVQATIAIQTFVARCFMGLEPEVSPTMAQDGRWDQWDWMKAYRLWESNRKVFLFPENWVEPEFRRDKSSAFKELQDELLQTELTEDSARDAFLNYIDKVDQVANLDVTGMFWEDGDGKGQGSVHVVGRTPGQEPHEYFYRRFDHPSERWTAWSKIELDLKSEPVLPFKYDRRTFLVWPEFRDKQPDLPGTIPIPASGGGTPASVEKPFVAVGVALSEHRNGKWSPKKVSAAFAPGPRLTFQTPELSGDFRDMFAWTAVDRRRIGGGVEFHWLEFRQRGALTSWWLRGPLPAYEFLGCRGVPERMPLNPLSLATVSFDWMLPLAGRHLQAAEFGPLIASGTSTYQIATRILDATPDRVRITYPHHVNSFDINFKRAAPSLAQFFGKREREEDKDWLVTGTRAPWVFADKTKTFYVEPVTVLDDGRPFTGSQILDLFEAVLATLPPHLLPLGRLLAELALLNDQKRRLRFSAFYHPRTCAFREALLDGGVRQLLSRPTQFGKGELDFAQRYQPVDGVVLRDRAPADRVYHPVEDVDFSSRGAYSLYNWELFYHAPFMVGTSLMKAGRHKEAMTWLRFIFDPGGADGKHPVTGVPLALADRRRFWITRPFFEREDPGYAAQRIESILQLLAARPGDPQQVAAREELIRQVATWRDNPFDPHLVASTRNIAYQKAAFIRFVENLVAWGDKLFAAPDVESVMAGGALYLYAKSFMGETPEVVPPRALPRVRSYAEIESDIDAFGNAMVAIEDLLPALPPVGPPESGPALPTVLHFCIPRNEKLLALWELVDDRVGKYQACRDLLGNPRKTSLFAPPIDPAAAIAAMMAGVSAGDLLAELSAPLPAYRFQTYLQKANELAGDLKAAGSALLSALEKKDGEALALLRQAQEIRLLEAGRAIKAAAVAEAEQQVVNLRIARDMATIRHQYYATRDFMSPGETAALALNTASLVLSGGAAVADTLGGVLAAIPNFDAGASGFGGSPVVTVSTGGVSFSKALEMAAKALTQVAGIVDRTAGMVSTVAGYQRRFEDWQLQAKVTAREIDQMAVQISAAEIRKKNAERELANHDIQVQNSRAIDEFMRTKYTNGELFAWMSGEISKTYFESYKLAYAHAKLAEQCFRFDHGLVTSSIVGFGAWDSARKGLQAGERLQLDLRRLDAAYLAENRRQFELTKNVSLAVAAPLALISLQRFGRCEVDLPEELFDLDYPGHFFRRIKSVSVSIPCVTGSSTTVACTLRLLRSSVRTTPALPGGAGGYPRRMSGGVDDRRFRDQQVPVAAIATSTGQNDAGLFELTMRDDRFLPFEGAGAISRWSLEMIEDESLRAFDYASIADVILHVRYTAREEGGAFKAASVANLKAQLQAGQSRLELRRVLQVSTEFAAAWTAFRNPGPGATPELHLPMNADRILSGGGDRVIRVRGVQLLAEYPRSAAGNEPDLECEVGAPPAAAPTVAPLVVDPGDSRYAASQLVTFAPVALGSTSTDWRLRFNEAGDVFSAFDPKTLTDLFLVVSYSVHPVP